MLTAWSGQARVVTILEIRDGKVTAFHTGRCPFLLMGLRQQWSRIVTVLSPRGGNVKTVSDSTMVDIANTRQLGANSRE